jgi:hypothetical protein
MRAMAREQQGHTEAQMKWLFAVAGLLLVSAAPAHAQIGGSISKVSFPPLISNPPTQFAVTVVSGTTQDFTPTTYASYDAAIAQGRAALAITQKSLGEVAQEHNREVKVKAKFTFEQDEYGQAMVTRP